MTAGIKKGRRLPVRWEVNLERQVRVTYFWPEISICAFCLSCTSPTLLLCVMFAPFLTEHRSKTLLLLTLICSPENHHYLSKHPFMSTFPA